MQEVIINIIIGIATVIFALGVCIPLIKKDAELIRMEQERDDDGT